MEKLAISNSTFEILIVESDVSLQNLLQNIFKKVDHRVHLTWATSSEKAVDLLQEKNFDLIISGYILNGEISGLDLWAHCQKRCYSSSFILTSLLGADGVFNVMSGRPSLPNFLLKPLQMNLGQDVLSSLAQTE